MKILFTIFLNDLRLRKLRCLSFIYNSKLNFEYKNGEKIISFKNNNNIDEL